LSDVLTPMTDETNVTAGGSIDCGHSLTRYIMQRAAYFRCGPMAGASRHKESLRPAAREQRAAPNLRDLQNEGDASESGRW
jgi:hypothetical protein